MYLSNRPRPPLYSPSFMLRSHYQEIEIRKRKGQKENEAVLLATIALLPIHICVISISRAIAFQVIESTNLTALQDGYVF